MKIFYQGFNTGSYEATGGDFAQLNIDVINQDLLNHIFTTPGERVNMPDWGTRIPLLVFELNDDYASQVIREDLNKVFNADPRVSLEALDIITAKNNYGLIASCRVYYKDFMVSQDLNIEITSQ